MGKLIKGCYIGGCQLDNRNCRSCSNWNVKEDFVCEECGESISDFMFEENNGICDTCLCGEEE